MSADAVKRVIGRLLSDDEFKKQFASDPATALSGLDLTPAEKEAVEKIDVSLIDSDNIKISNDMDRGISVGALYLTK